MKKFKILLIYLLMGFIAFGYEPKVILTVSDEYIHSGDRLRVRITARAPKGAKVVFPNLKTISGYPIKKVEPKEFNIRLKNGIEIFKKTARYTIYPTKELTIKPFTVWIDGKPYRTKTRRIYLIKDKKSTKTNKSEKGEVKAEKREAKAEEKSDNKDLKPKDEKLLLDIGDNNIDIKDENILAEETPPQPQKKSKEPHSKYDIIPEDELADVELQKELQSLGLDDVDSGNKKDDISDFKFIMESSKSLCYKNEAVLLTIKMIQPINVSVVNIEYQPPKFNGFKAVQLNDGELIDNGTNIVRVIDYMIKPIKTGKLRIEPAISKLEIELTTALQAPFGFPGGDIQWKNLITNSLSITAKPIPKGIKLVGDFKAKVKFKDNVYQKDKPFEFTLEVHGKGDLGDLVIPKFKLKDVKVLGNEPKIRREVVDGEIYTKYSQTFAILSKRESIIIPAFQFRAFNPESRRVYKFGTKAISINAQEEITQDVINRKVGSVSKSLVVGATAGAATAGVAGGAISKALTANTQDINQSQLQQQDNNSNLTGALQSKLKDIPTAERNNFNETEEILFDMEYYKRKLEELEENKISAFMMFILGVITGSLAFIYLPKLIKIIKAKRENTKLYESYEEALSILYPHTTESEEIEEMVKLLYEVTNGNKEIKIDDSKLNSMVEKVLFKKGSKKSKKLKK
jgi:hypothetical protein